MKPSKDIIFAHWTRQCGRIGTFRGVDSGEFGRTSQGVHQRERREFSRDGDWEYSLVDVYFNHDVVHAT